MNKYSKELIEQIQREVETTLKTVKQISEEHNIPKNTVQCWCTKYKWERPKEFREKLLESKGKGKSKIIRDNNYYKAKDLYENTSMPAKDIAEQCNLTLNKFWIRVRTDNWIRSNELKHQLQSNKFKTIIENLTPEKKQEQKRKMSETNKKVWKERSLEERQKIIKHRQQTMKLKSKEEIDVIKNKISQSVQNTWDNYDPIKRQQINKQMSQSQQNLTIEQRKLKARRDRETKLKNNSFRNVTKIDGLSFDSNYEVIVYEFCRRNNISLRTQIPIEYNYNNEVHTTFIDFEIDGMLFECKGGHLMKGVFDDKLPVPIKQKLEVYKKNNVIVITDKLGSELIPNGNSKYSNGLKYLNKCKDPLIGVDIDLFRNPDFPYAVDKPKCFYKVRVDGKPSALDAWNDELLRWKMIKNRINYVGGFIDNKSILNAMNVTRTCKQPSWFDKNYAKELIRKYITTDLILDPFAGWGTRCDASVELGKKYVGCDMNEELVNWHTGLNRNIIYGDANYFTSDESDCSVFICPPYTDFEVYFDGQDTKTTQCGWLLQVMKNIPNAKEYLMVCKVVDKGWEQFIVEEKVNKSHLGTNKEYVIYLTNKQSKILQGN